MCDSYRERCSDCASRQFCGHLQAVSGDSADIHVVCSAFDVVTTRQNSININFRVGGEPN